MKKLMIVAAAVMLAGMTQAASFYWGTASSTTGKLVDDKGVVQTSVTGGSIALVLLGTDTTKYSDATWLMDATFTSSTKANANGRINNSYTFTWVEDDHPSNTLNNGDVLAVLFKDDKGNYSKLVNASTGAEIDATYTLSGVTTATWSNSTSPWTFTTANYQTVPEPTSGLLMVLGLAGLALRRKRA